MDIICILDENQVSLREERMKEKNRREKRKKARWMWNVWDESLINTKQIIKKDLIAGNRF